MNMGRTYFLLLAGIALLAIAHLTIDVRSGEGPQLLPRVALMPSAGRAAEFSVRRAGAGEVKVVRDGEWRLVAPFAAAVEESAVLRLVDSLATVPIDDELSDSDLLRLGRTRGDFMLDAPRLEVEVGGEHGGKVLFGDSTSAGDGVYAAITGVASVFVVPTNVFAAVDVGVDDLRRRRFVPDMRSAVSSIEVSGAGCRFCVRRERGAWKMVEPRKGVVSQAKVEGLMSALGGLSAMSFAWPVATTNLPVGAASRIPQGLLAGYGLDGDTAMRVFVKCEDGAEVRVAFGKTADSSVTYAMSESDGTVVALEGGVRDRIAAMVDGLTDTRLFPLKSAEVESVRLDYGDVVYDVVREKDGAWRMDSPVLAPASPETVGALVDRLVQLNSTDVASAGVKVTVGACEPVTVLNERLGESFRPETLRSLEVVKVDANRIRRIVVTDAGKSPLSVVYDADRRAWSMERASDGAVADQAAIGRLIALISPLKALRVEKLKQKAADSSTYGLVAPVRVIAIDSSDERVMRQNIVIGETAGGGRFVAAGSFDTVFALSGEVLDGLLRPIAR